MTDAATTLPSRRERLQTFVDLKSQNHALRWVTAALILLVAVISLAFIGQDADADPVMLGKGVAGVDRTLTPYAAAARAEKGLEAVFSEATRDLGLGEASFYGDSFAGKATASGETFDPAKMTAAHRTLPLGSKVRVTHSGTGDSVVVRINDRGPFHGNRVIDLSKASAKRLGMLNSGTARVKLELLTRA